jgi:hypothetical protein
VFSGISYAELSGIIAAEGGAYRSVPIVNVSVCLQDDVTPCRCCKTQQQALMYTL